MNVAGTFPGLGLWDELKSRKQAEPQGPSSLLPDPKCHVTSSFTPYHHLFLVAKACSLTLRDKTEQTNKNTSFFKPLSLAILSQPSVGQMLTIGQVHYTWWL